MPRHRTLTGRSERQRRRNIYLINLGLRNSASCVKSDSSPTLEPVTNPVRHAEGPHWDYNCKVLYYVDIVDQRVYRYNPENKQVTSIYLEGGPVSPAVPEENTNCFVAGVGRNIVKFEWDCWKDKTLSKNDYQILASVESNRPGNRFNDGKADSEGRLWAGTIGPEKNRVVVPEQANFYMFTKQNLKNPTVKLNPVTNSNGLVWNKENDKFYYIDTPLLKIWKFDYDYRTGEISNKIIAFDLVKNNVTGLPDGMTIDTDGNLWIALFLGGAVIKVNPNSGKLLQKIDIPADQVTSVTFGGPKFDILFVTTSKENVDPEKLKYQPLAGSVFAVHNLNAKGFKQNYVKL